VIQSLLVPGLCQELTLAPVTNRLCVTGAPGVWESIGNNQVITNRFSLPGELVIRSLVMAGPVPINGAGTRYHQALRHERPWCVGIHR
jgi:hypothetical protein